MASLTQWTWLWANSGRLWRTGKPGVLQSRGSQRVGHNLATEQELNKSLSCVQLFCDPMDYSPPGSPGISQARTLEWVAISFSRGSSQSRDWTHIFLHWQADSLPLSPQGHLLSLDRCPRSRETTQELTQTKSSLADPLSCTWLLQSSGCLKTGIPLTRKPPPQQ